MCDDKSFIDVEGESAKTMNTFIFAVLTNVFHAGQFDMIRDSMRHHFESNGGKVESRNKKLVDRCMRVFAEQYNQTKPRAERAAVLAPLTREYKGLENGITRKELR